VVAAEVLLVIALIALNLYLWVRPGRGDDVASAESTASGATSVATPAGGSASATEPSTASATTSATASMSASSATTSAATSTAAPAPSTPIPDPTTALRAAGRLVVVVDSSASMAAHLPTVKDSLTELFRQVPDGVTVGLTTYSPAGVAVLVPAEPVNGDRREQLVKAVQGLTTTAGTNRPVFDALTLSYQHVLAGQPGSDPAPILMAITDGGRSGGADLATFVTFAKAETAKRARSATPRFVGITPGADMTLLNQVVDAVGGRAVAAGTPSQLHDAILTLP